MKDVNQTHGVAVLPVWGEAACICLLIVAQSALANPTGGKVTQGNATITNSGTTTTIQQSSNKAIINWNSFSINPNETTQFLQPSSKSFTLNRVIGGNPSQILGHLSANGTVYIINQNGILFGKNAVVNVGGLIASTSNISDKQFMSNGPQNFTLSPSDASIVNEGTISIKDAGIAVLVSPTVVNDGIISANLGTVALASGDHFTLDLYGDNLISFDAGKAMTNEILDNKGIIQANGGKVMLTAQAADALVSNTINMDGIIEAQSVSTKNGKVVLQGGDNSTVNVSGKIDVSGRKSGETGGLAQVTGTTVNLKNGSTIDASGDAGGGTVNIGGEPHGAGTLAHANNVNMDATATVLASAWTKGNGGIVSLWSDENTNANGSIYAQGGAASGNGGWIETSSHNTLDTSGAVINASATQGLAGTWLIDPITLTITDATALGYQNSLQLGTDVLVSTSDQIQFTNTTQNITWNTGATLSLWSNTAANSIGADSILYSGGCTAGVTCQINSTGSGAVNFYYTPTAYATPTSFASYVTGPFTAYMEVNNATELQNISTNLAGSYALNTNISLPVFVNNFTTLGPFSGNFTGNIQGTQFTISNLNINQPATNNIGLFSSVSGTLDSVHLDNATIVGLDNVGAVVGTSTGTLSGSFSVTNSSITGSGNNLGGIVGYMNGGTMGATATMNTDSSTTVTGTSGATNGTAGLIGNINLAAGTWSAFGTFSNSATVTSLGDNVGGVSGQFIAPLFPSIGATFTNSGTINGGNSVGGVFGRTSVSLNGSSTNSGDVSGGNFVGGYVGTSTLNTSLFDFTNSGTITGSGSNIGGAIGEAISTILFGTYNNTGTVNGVNQVGGFVGYFDAGSQTTATMHNYANVQGTTDVGGVLGLNDGNASFGVLIDSGNHITGSSNVGGIVGNNTGTISFARVNDAIIENSLGGDHAGGIAGYSGFGLQNGSVTNPTVFGGSGCYSGGFVGVNLGSVSDVSFSGQLTNISTNAGGIAGYNGFNTIQNALSLGSINGSPSPSVGALVGNNQGTLTNSFYDTSKTGSLSAVGSISGSPAGPGVFGSTAYATTNPLSRLSTFTNNGFSAFTWTQITGYYPSISWCGSSCVTLLPSVIIPDANTVQTQYVNGVITNVPQPSITTNSLMVTPAGSVLADMVIDSPEAVGYLGDSFVVQGLGGMSTQENSDPDYVKHAMGDTVRALQKARGCAAK